MGTFGVEIKVEIKIKIIQYVCIPYITHSVMSWMTLIKTFPLIHY